MKNPYKYHLGKSVVWALQRLGKGSFRTITEHLNYYTELDITSGDYNQDLKDEIKGKKRVEFKEHQVKNQLRRLKETSIFGKLITCDKKYKPQIYILDEEARYIPMKIACLMTGGKAYDHRHLSKSRYNYIIKKGDCIKKNLQDVVKYCDNVIGLISEIKQDAKKIKRGK